jgi:hypothetical protein
MTILLTAVAVALIVAAVALLYLKWQGKPWPWAVPVAWGALVVSAGLWMTAYKPDYGLPFGFLIFMSLPLLLIAGRIDWKGKPEKQRRAKAVPDVAEHWTPGRTGRIVARVLACLIIAPLIGMIVGMVAWRYMPGHEATRYALGVFIFNLVSAIALIVACSAQRPWRVLGFMTAVVVTGSGIIGLPLLTGALS